MGAAPVPVPASPSHSLDYSSSFASPPVSSSSPHASPLKSPVKSDSSIKIVNNSSQSPAAAPKSPKKSLNESSATSCRDQNIVETKFSRSTLNVDPKPESPVSSIYTEEEISEASGLECSVPSADRAREMRMNWAESSLSGRGATSQMRT